MTKSGAKTRTVQDLEFDAVTNKPSELPITEIATMWNTSHNTYNLTLYSSSSVVTTRITVVRSMCPSGSSYQQEKHQQVKYNWHKISLLLVKKIRSYAFHTCMTWGCDRQFAELKCKLTMLSMNKQFLNLNQSIIQYRGVHNINSIQVCWKSLKLHFGKTVF